MNKKIILIMGIFVMVGLVYASTILYGSNSYESNEDGLVLDIDLSQSNYNSSTDTFTDDSGEGNDGVSVNAATFTTDKYGKSTGAMSFNGVNDYIDVPDSTSLRVADGDFSVAFWMKPILPGKVVHPIGTESKVFIDKGWNFRFESDNTFVFRVNDGSGPIAADAGTPKDNEWQHFVGVVDSGNTIYVYVDGILKDSSALSGATDFEINFGVEIGNIESYSGRWFNGSISSVKIYNQALSADEITQLYNDNKPKLKISSFAKGLIGHYVLDAESYNTNTERISDKTPYENHGTNNGAILTTDQNGQSNRAMYFDGADYIDMGYDSSMDTCSITVAAWVKPVDSGPASDTDRIVSRDRSDYWMLGQSTNNRIEWTIYEGTMYQYFSNNNVLTADQWSLVVGTYDGTTGEMKAYVDGVEVISQTPTTCSGVLGIGSNRPLAIGTNVEATPQGNSGFNGDISDVRIYNHALSADEIDTLYHSYRPKAASGSLLKGLVLDMPLKIRYTKDETAGSEIMTDRTPYSNDGQNYGATVGSDYTGFDGVDDYVDCGSDESLDLGTGDFTVSLWLKTSTATDNNVLVGKLSVSIWTGFEIEQEGNKIEFYLNSMHGIFTSCPTINDDEWHFIAVKRVGENIYLYVDGEYIQTLNNANYALNVNVSDTLKIGKNDYTTFNTFFDGLIDEVRIYNRALSESEIKLLFDKGR